MRNLIIVTVLLGGLVVLAACGGQTGAKPGGAGDQPVAGAPAGQQGEAGQGEEAKEGEEGEAVVAGDPAKGKVVFDGTCQACHGPDAKGREGLGKDLTASTFVADRTDDEMVAFIKVGRAPDDPLNTTGVLMPPKGGNPAMTEAQMRDVIAYVRSLQQ
jgi:mono/diheme cytochrome c family protein